MKYLKYLTIAIKFISMADKVQVLETIEKAIADRKLTINELIDISQRLCKAANIDLDTKGIKF
ncbi:MAG: hypothetical protein ACFFDY_01305 [Candidatus Thorarchaeota archaeon]